MLIKGLDPTYGRRRFNTLLEAQKFSCDKGIVYNFQNEIFLIITRIVSKKFRHYYMEYKEFLYILTMISWNTWNCYGRE